MISSVSLTLSWPDIAVWDTIYCCGPHFYKATIQWKPLQRRHTHMTNDCRNSGQPGHLPSNILCNLRIVTTWPRLMKSEENIWRYLKELSIKVMWRRRIHGQGWFLHWFDDIHFSCVTQEITKQRLLSTETERQVYNLVGL